MGLELGGRLDDVHLVAQCLLDKVESILERLVHGLFVLAFAQVEVAVDDGHELLLLVVSEHVRDEAVGAVGEVEYLYASVLEDLGLRHLVDRVERIAGGIVDVLLIVFHPLNIFRESDRLLLRR